MKSAEKVRLCILTTDSSWGGTEKMIHTLVCGLDPARFSIALATLKGDGTLLGRVESRCVRTINFEAGFAGDLRVFRRLLHFLREGRYQLLHTYLFHANCAGRLAGRLAGIPAIISSQRNVDGWRIRRHILLDRWTARWCDAVISNSQAGRDRLASVEKIPPEKISVVHNGLDLTEVPERRHGGSGRAGNGVRPGPVIGMVANFRAHKGHRTFLKAAQLLSSRRGDLAFVIAGEGRERPGCEAFARDLDIAERVRFLGRVENVYSALELMDVFVLPSDWEGFPVSILEAMAYGLPVIASDAGGTREIVHDGVTGLLVAPRDAHGLTQAVIRLLDDPDLAENLVGRARDEIHRRFTLERMVRDTVSVYERVLDSKGIAHSS